MAIPHTAAPQKPKGISHALDQSGDDMESLNKFLAALAKFQKKVAEYQAQSEPAAVPKDKVS